MKIKLIFLLIIFILVSVFFKDFILKGQLPIPADTIVGLYHPFSDLYKDQYPRGVPFKNFLITDPVRQQYPWKSLVIEAEKKITLPIWNPYNFSGTPLLANFQSGALYPFNLLFFILPFQLSWSMLILIQPLLAAVFLFLFLDNLKLNKKASLIGAITFAFCGFSVSWMEWGNIVSTALWLPLLFLGTDKILEHFKNREKLITWSFIYFISLTFSFLAGHLQIFFYVFVVNIIYSMFKIHSLKQYKKQIILFAGLILGFILATSAVWIPTLKFIMLSARSLDQANWMDPGWFIPWQNLIQFLAPDFFGNPATLNYFGVWNYGEFVGYIGIAALVFSLFSVFFRRDKKTAFFTAVLVLSLILALPNFISKIPYKLYIPFISTSQPTRLMFLIDLCLSILTALGLDLFLKTKNKRNILIPLFVILICFAGLWLIVLGNGLGIIKVSDILIAKRNLIFPSILFGILFFVFLFLLLFPSKQKQYQKVLDLSIYFVILVLIFDLFRFGWKYLTFSSPQYLFPQTKTISFLQKNVGNFRIMETDSKILPPNFSAVYKLQSIDGYDPLYLQRYAELMAAIGRTAPDIHSPFGFNRIITPQNYLSPLINLLGVKYILSVDDINVPRLKKVFSEGSTRVYENMNVQDRVFFISKTINGQTKQDEINLMYSEYPLRDRAVVSSSNEKMFDRDWGMGISRITSYTADKVEITTKNENEGFLVLTDNFYPSWHATVDGKETQIYITDFTFRGIIVPKGEHKIIFYDTLLNI